MDERTTLAIDNLCKIGWNLDETTGRIDDSLRRIASALERIASNMEPLIVDHALGAKRIFDLEIRRRDAGKSGHLP